MTGKSLLRCVAAMCATLFSIQLGAETLSSYGFDDVRGAKFHSYPVEAKSPGSKDKVLHFTYSSPGRKPIFYHRVNFKLSGDVCVRLYLKGKNLKRLGPTMKFHIMFHNVKTNKSDLFDNSMFTPMVSQDSFKPVDFMCKLPIEPATYNILILPIWDKITSKVKPEIWLDKVELIDENNGQPYVTGVQLNKNCFPFGEEPEATIGVVNPTKKKFSGTLDLSVLSGLNHSAEAKKIPVEVAPDSFKTIKASFKVEEKELGHSLQAALKNTSGKTLSEKSRYFAVGNDQRFFQTMNFYSVDSPKQYIHTVYLFWPPSGQRLMDEGLDFMFNRLLTRKEDFSWSWCELAGFLPPEDPYIGTEGCWWISLDRYKKMSSYYDKHGIRPISYVQGHLFSEAAYKLYEDHPEWFLYDRKGNLVGGYFNMHDRDNYQKRHSFDFKLHKKRYLYGLLNPLLPECRQWIADQFIELYKFGYKGIRWDVWAMEVKPGWYDIMGNEVAKNWKEADEKSAESLRVLKKLVNDKIPEYTWGYNYGAPEENVDLSKYFDEKCRDNGWILDETTCAYEKKTSPYHFWDAYRDRIIGWGDVVRKKGGIYNPFKIKRSGADYDIDRLYTGIIQVISGGRSYFHYENQNAGLGRVGALPFRFSDIYIGRNLSLLPKSQKYVTVKSPAPLWWDTIVHTNVNTRGNRQIIVHLINPPYAKEIEENPQNIMTPAVKNITVTAGKYDGKMPKKAFLLMAESYKTGVMPKTQAVPLKMTVKNDKATVVVPEIIAYKSVVFEY